MVLELLLWHGEWLLAAGLLARTGMWPVRGGGGHGPWSWSLGTTLDGQTDSVKKYKVQNSSVRRQPVRCPQGRNGARRPDRFSQKVQSTEFVCPSSTRPMSAGSERRSTARQISQKVQNSSVRCLVG